MKKKSLLAVLSLVISASLLAGCNVHFGITSRENKRSIFDTLIESITHNAISLNNNSNSTSTALYKEDLHTTLSTDNIKNLNISIIASEVTIKSISGSEITLDCTGSSNIVKETTYDKTQDTIYIKEHGVTDINFNGFNNSGSRKVIIGIPASFEGNAVISSGAGTVDISNVTFNSIDLEGGMGELNISNIKFKDLILKQGMGETSINLSDKCGNMNISGGMGEFSLTLKEVGGNLTYSGGMGEAIIDIPDNAPVKLETDTGMGETNITATTSGENTYIFDLSVGMGSLTVK